jgi:hypothetical protein
VLANATAYKAGCRKTPAHQQLAIDAPRNAENNIIITSVIQPHLLPFSDYSHERAEK